MITEIIEFLAGWIINVISSLGYFGVVLLMAIESANIPLPSEIIMPFSGYLVSIGQFNLWWTGFWGAVGNLLGSIFSYWLGVVGGRPLIEKYGRYILISHHDLDQADKWFKKHGEITVFLGRLLPVIRTFISFPAGISRMNFSRFVLYSFLGALPFSWFLTYLGMKVGENREVLSRYFHQFDALIGLLLLLGVGWYVWRHLKNSKLKSFKK